MPEKSAALEAFGRGVREGAGQRLGVIPTPTQISRVCPVQPGLTKFNEISMMCKRLNNMPCARKVANKINFPTRKRLCGENNITLCLTVKGHLRAGSGPDVCQEFSQTLKE